MLCSSLCGCLKGIVHYFTMSILTKQAVYGHQNGALFGHGTEGEIYNMKKLKDKSVKNEDQIDWLDLPAD